MRNISFFSVLVIIFLFSVNYSINGEQLTINNEQEAENNEQFFVNHNISEVNKEPKSGSVPKNRSYGFSIGQQFGFVDAQAVEIVYPKQTEVKYLSELLWNMKPLYYMGILAEFGLDDIMSKAGFFSNLSFKTGFPGDTGIHENRDWLSFENTDLTHYSRHTNRTNRVIMIDFKNGASIPFTYVYIKPFINFSWMNFSFSGLDGYGKYARGKKYDDNGIPIEDKSSYPSMYFPINDDPKIVKYYSEVITYEQNWLLIAPGITLGTKILTPFSFDISFQISPLTYCAAVDNHLTTKAVYNDYTGLGLYLEGTAYISFSWDFLELAYEAAYRYISDTRGITHQGSQGSDYTFKSPNEAGAGLSMMDMRLLFKFRF